MTRSEFQGVATVVRFNWPFFVIALAGAIALGVSSFFVPSWLGVACALVGFGIMLTTVSSLLGTYLAYDASSLYRLEWLAPHLPENGEAANIHAGFDETTELLRSQFGQLNWCAMDFYDPQIHTEASIRRARASQPAIEGTIEFHSRSIPARDQQFDIVLLTLAAHEIRDRQERIDFFTEIRRVLKPDGRAIVTEHLRDIPNYLTYSIGALHFHSRSAWMDSFDGANLSVEAEIRPAPLIHTFILCK